MIEPLSAHLPGLAQLWQRTLGDPRVTVALLDGPVDRTHPALRGQLLQSSVGASSWASSGLASAHGTGIASLLFGRHDSAAPGLAPHCRGWVNPIFESNPDGSIRPCSQLDLARALSEALRVGAQIVNVSAGEFSPSGAAHPMLAEVVAECARREILIVAATGNEGCECLHLPAALDTVLAVGAIDSEGQPLSFSNWGGAYQTQGIVTLGENLLVAELGGGATRRSGTSYATAIVSGVAALMLSEQLARGQTPDPRKVREALLQTAHRCDAQLNSNCSRWLVGRLNIPDAVSQLFEEPLVMSEVSETRSIEIASIPKPTSTVQPSGFSASDCGCNVPGQKAYVLGQLGHDLVSEARADSLSQAIAVTLGEPTPQRSFAFDLRSLLTHLTKKPWESTAVEWTLSLDGSVIYAIRPQGPYAAETYAQLRTLLQQQLDEGVERISLPGTISGTARLLTGQSVPVLIPEPRGMYSWNTKELVRAAVGAAPPEDASKHDKEAHEQTVTGVRNFLDRVYYGHRNLGVLPQDRALNFAATNAFNFEKIYESAVKEQMELESIAVTPSPFCRPGSDCWDVEVYFFYPDRPVQNVRKVYRFTVDVSDIVPVTVGPMRAWFVR